MTLKKQKMTYTKKSTILEVKKKEKASSNQSCDLRG